MITTVQIRHFVINAFFATSLYLAYFKGNAQAETVSLFIAWAAIILGIFVSFALKGEAHLKSETLLKSISEKPFSVHVAVDLLFDISVIAVFMYADKWLVAVLYMISTLCMLSVRENVNKYRANILVQEAKTSKLLVF